MKPRIPLGIALFIAGLFVGIDVWQFPVMGQIIGTILAGMLFLLGFLIVTERDEYENPN